MSSLKMSCNPSAKRQPAVLPVILLVVLVLIVQTLSQSVMASVVPSQQSDEVNAKPASNAHHQSADHHASVPAVDGSDVDGSESAQSDAAHHTSHDHDDGCCFLAVCGGACSGVCSGSYLGDPSATSAPFKPTLISVTVRDAIDNSLLARPPGVPFRPPIHGHYSAG